MGTSRSPVMIGTAAFDAAIFDLDGVVTKTARVHATAWKKLFDQYLEHRAEQDNSAFRPFDIQTDYRQYVDGKLRDEGVQTFLDSRGLTLPYGDPSDAPDRETICGLGNRKNAFFREALKEQGVESFPSTLAFIRDARSHGLKIAIVSSSKNCAAVLEAAGISTLFDVKVDGLDVARDHLKGKPAPDVFLRAASRLGVLPARAIIFEDAVAGVQAAREAAFGLVVGVDRVGQSAVLEACGADLIVSDLGELTLLPSALDSAEDIFRRARDKELVVFLDYDGTLTPIAERPELATMTEDMRCTLKSLAKHCVVAIISGRDRSDVERLVRLDSLFYAGSHGFDIAGPHGQHFRHEEGSRFLPEIDRAEKALTERLRGVKGALIERKKYSVAVHYRLVSPEQLGEIQEAVDAALSEHPILRQQEGKKVYELQPRIDWDKGKAVLWLFRALELEPRTALPLYLGDDVTDEDAFRALVGIGIGIFVGAHARSTAARYSLNNPSEVQKFLVRLIALLENKHS